MGYYTNFELNTKWNNYPINEIATYMKKKNQGSDWFYPFEYEIDEILFDTSKLDFSFGWTEKAKWYDHDKEMIDLSKQFPKTVFCLYGEGEENEDIWYTYYKNGKQQYCPVKMTFDEYDESKLV